MSDTTSPNSVFLTGGTGFLGSHLRDTLADEDVNVTLLVRPGTTVDSASNETILRGDITNSETLDIDGHEAVIHLAAQTSIERSIEMPIPTWKINATGSLNILEAVRDADIDRFLYASTASVYGPPESLPIKESHPMNPTEIYGASKVAGDRLAHAYCRTYGVPTIIARIFNTFGPGQQMHNVVPVIINQALEEDIVELGNLSPSRDFLYVKDTISALMTILSEGKCGETYNIGSGNDVQIGKLAEHVIELIGKDIEIVSTMDRQRDNNVEIPRHVADISKIHHIGWKPSYGLEAGLEETIQAFKQ